MNILINYHQTNLRIKNCRLFFLTFILFLSILCAFSGEREMNYPLKKEIKWFTDSRFGMFSHWTPLGAIDQEIGWTWGTDVPAEKYIQLCREFNPVKFDAEAWVELLKMPG